MSLRTLKAQAPVWALDAGLPAPRRGERFIPYVERLGLRADDLLDDLTDRTAEIANIRLEHRLHEALPQAFDRCVDKLADANLSPERRIYLQNTARALFPGRYRKRPRPVV